MGNKNKSKKNQTTGGLQPKGGAYANRDAQLAATGASSFEQGSTLNGQPFDKKAAKDARKAEIAKARDKAKKEKAEKKTSKKKGGLVQALRETGSELKKVRWPSFGTAVKQTSMVLGMVIIFSIVVFGIDKGLSALYELLIG